MIELKIKSRHMDDNNTIIIEIPKSMLSNHLVYVKSLHKFF